MPTTVEEKIDNFEVEPEDKFDHPQDIVDERDKFGEEFGDELADELEDEVDAGSISHYRTFNTLAMFSLIMLSYSTSFLAMVKLGFWLADTTTTSSTEFQAEYAKTSMLSWLVEVVYSEDWFNSNFKKLGVDLCLLIGFILQHTLLSSRVLKNTRVWYMLHHEYKIDKPLYMLTTAFALTLLIRFWEPIPVKVWDLEISIPVLQWVHVAAWASMYGTVLMLDLPEMIGLNQVVIESPTRTVKSPEFQMMLQQQRHMGLVPFIVVFVTYPHMSLDRLILSLMLTWYLCRQWASDFAYEYARDMKQVKKLKLSL